MSRPSISIAIQSNKTAEEYAELGARTEAYGFDVISVYNDLMFQPAFYPLLQIALNTERIRLGAACLNPFTVMPHEIAGQIAALDAVSGGRAYLGLAKGAWLDAVGVDQPDPVRTLQEAAAVVYHLLRGDESAFEGEVFRLAANTTLQYPVHRPDPPLMIGTWGERTAAALAHMADEIKVGGSANPRMVETMRGYLDAAPQRDDGPQTGIVIGAVTVVDEDGQAARQKASEEVALYLPVVAELDPTADVDFELVDRVRQHVKAGDHQQAGALIPDRILDLFCFSGTPEKVADQAAALFDAGAARVEFGTPHGLTSIGGLDLLGTQVLPRLRD